MLKKKIAVLLSGGGTDFQSILDGIDNNLINGEVVLVISNKDNAYGLERAKKHNIPTYVVKKDDAKIVDLCKEKNVDFIVLAGYLAILTSTLINAYVNKIINIHPALIPSFSGPGFYGMHVHEAVFKKGVKISGATIHFVSEEVDGGMIIYQEAVDIADVTTPEEIQQRVLKTEHKILPFIVSKMCDDKIIIENGKAKVL